MQICVKDNDALPFANYYEIYVKVDSFLTACLVLTFALVVGLGLGHFLGEPATFSLFPHRIKLILDPHLSQCLFIIHWLVRTILSKPWPVARPR